MTPGLKISNCLAERLSKIDQPCRGGLYGLMFNRSLLLIGMSVDLDGVDGVEPFTEMQLCFPTGIDFCGLIKSGDNINNDIKVQEEIMKDLKEIIVTDNPVVLLKDVSTGDMSIQFFCNGRLKPTEYEIFTMDELNKSFVMLRLQTSLCIYTSIEPNDIIESIETLKKKVSSGGVIFHFRFSNAYVHCVDEYSDSLQLGELNDQITLSRDRRVKQGIMDVTMLLETSGPYYEDNHAPIATTSLSSETDKLTMALPIDALCLAQRARLLNETYGLLIDTVYRSIQLFQQHLLKIISTASRICKLRHFHFMPSPLGHHMTLIYPDDASENILCGQRRRLHKELLLPTSLPHFRRANRLNLTTRIPPQSPLLNVHEYLKYTGVKGGRVSLVQGYYLYFHYMQNNVDDNGWGCAYRSLQTLFSWYSLQGYTILDVPSHSDIQKCLVDIQDKPVQFIGSKQWIGSTEVAYCLDTMLNVTSRIVGVSSGSELDSVAEELQTHFDVHGTPVMIGGGVLAHTILGIDFNPITNELKFLVLDPHYPGTEDIKIIVSRGWVSWKTKDFWDKKSFYNLCLPQRPSEI